MRTNGNGGSGLSQPRTPLLPVGVNNKATMPKRAQAYQAVGEEVIRIVTVDPGSTAGQIVFNQQIGPNSTARLSRLADLWQRIDWNKTTLNIVALNGSIVTSGYNVGFVEDPQLDVPTTSSEIIPFLTALRSTSVRQNWVQSESGQTVSLSCLPEMYTHLGSDPRRYYIGRLVMAMTGDVTTAASFQIMLRYTVNLYVPRVVLPPAPPPPPPETYELPFAIFSTRSTTNQPGPLQPSIQCVAPVPDIGRYLLNSDIATRQAFIASADSVESYFFAGFEVVDPTLGWSAGTRGILKTAPTTSMPWAAMPENDGPNEAGYWCVVVGTNETYTNFTIFNPGDTFLYTSSV